MICADASLAAKWLLDEERSDRARALSNATLHSGQPLVAPPLLPIELTNIVRRRMRAPYQLSREEATDLLDTFLAMPIILHNPPSIHQRALLLADAYGLPATYDAHYVVVAQHLGCDLWTDDQRLVRRLAAELPFVRWIGDYEANSN